MPKLTQLQWLNRIDGKLDIMTRMINKQSMSKEINDIALTYVNQEYRWMDAGKPLDINNSGMVCEILSLMGLLCSVRTLPPDTLYTRYETVRAAQTGCIAFYGGKSIDRCLFMVSPTAGIGADMSRLGCKIGEGNGMVVPTVGLISIYHYGEISGYVDPFRNVRPL